MFADIFERGKLGPEFQEDLKKLRRTCYSCGKKYAGQKSVQLIILVDVDGDEKVKYVEIECRICPFCWLDGSEMYLVAIIYPYNQDVPRSVIQQMVELQKFWLEGEFRDKRIAV
jgi:hypothetical protein